MFSNITLYDEKYKKEKNRFDKGYEILSSPTMIKNMNSEG